VTLILLDNGKKNTNNTPLRSSLVLLAGCNKTPLRTSDFAASVGDVEGLYCNTACYKNGNHCH
jgi:hypothetical protein